MSPANPNHVRHATNHVNAENPVFAREEVRMPAHVSIGQAEAIQTGTAPTPNTGTPLLNDEAVAAAGTVYLNADHSPAAVSDGEKLVPIDLEKQPLMLDGSGTASEDDETEEEEETSEPKEEPESQLNASASMAGEPSPTQIPHVEEEEQPA